jgi:hypothetical protein
MKLVYPLLLLLLGMPCAGQLTPEQRRSDMTQLANLFAKYYAPYEWKREARGFDLMDLQPWLERASAVQDDIEFMELLVEYAAALDDGHVGVFFPSNFVARLGFSADLYDGKVLIDSISRSLLPQDRYPFEIGDEVVSVDGRPVADLLKEFGKYYAGGNPRTKARVAASRIFSRFQQLMPSAARVGESATVVIRRAAGQEETYNIPWTKSGLPLAGAGGAVSPKSFLRQNTAEVSDPVSPYTIFRVPRPVRATIGWGDRNPVFALPQGFVRRRGASPVDYFLSGTFDYAGFKIGYIRIPDFEPASISGALSQFDSEIRYFQQNTDGLIVDVMRNPGGYGSYCEELLRRLIPRRFRTIGFEIRATADWIQYFEDALTEARLLLQPNWVIQMLQINLDFVRTAYSEVRGRTGAISLNSTGSLELIPVSYAYTKPLMVLTDELSASAADFFPAVIQDNGRGPVFGYRTMGLGGGPTPFDATYYTESFAYVTRSLMVRKEVVRTPEFPDTYYIENVGVRPDIEVDYMTRDNLLNRGRAFVEAFSQAMAEHIRQEGAR